MSDAAAARVFEPLPIDERRGFPQTFGLLVRGASYRLTLHVNIAAELVPAKAGLLPIPGERAFLVVRVERAQADGQFDTILTRKVLPLVEYEVGDIVLRFTEQRVARDNLNGQGDLGSRVQGEVADRWA